MEASGALLRTARKMGGLSQAELARLAGTTQSVISAYESGARQPSLPTLARLVEATGCGLDLSVSPPAGVRRLEGPLARRVLEHRDEILELLQRGGLSNPRLFGSAARGDDKPGSDIDLLVDVSPHVGLVGLARCQARLEGLLGAPVDLVPAGDLKAGLVDEVLAEALAL